MKKLIPKSIKILIKKLIWHWYLVSGNPKPFNPLYKKIIRGKHIDRFYIERFMEKNSNSIKGVCLEIADNEYTKKFGKPKESHILDIDLKNEKADIHGDLRSLPQIASNTFNCLILTQTLQYIDDYHSAIKECHRILKPGGVVLATVPSVSRIGYSGVSGDFWRFTQAGAEYAFRKVFGKVRAEAFGNARVCIKNLVGAS
jgi:SAM-dependent methyltransferase